MKHDELQEDLATHLRGATDRMVWTNTQLGPSGSPRPDVFTVNKSFSRFRTDCYEIKVSVSDLRHDVTSGKWQSYRKFGHAVWFAFPRGLVPLELVPAECGIILRGETWRAARKPVAQVMDTLPRDAWLKLLMCDMPRFGQGRTTPRSAHEWQAERVAREKWGDELAELFRARMRAVHQYEWVTQKKLDAAEALKKEIERDRQYALEREKRASESLNEALQGLAITLGLAKDATAHDVTVAVRRMQKALNGHGLTEAIALLQTMQGALKEDVSV